ncbi:hypothetical protein ACFFTN_09785 [Aminobacter aganoensis]|uniref:Replication protein n=1 Tax=Aminobacter aganoensis TaxID=83264 RepID=A0A7X0FB86_9HYPH|nr:hypothetical protein [Aminobacter aganoensis]MBB6356318.1 hypothetical protein [Aminobacter aganoensis]
MVKLPHRSFGMPGVQVDYDEEAMSVVEALTSMNVQQLETPEALYHRHIARLARLARNKVPQYEWRHLKHCDGGPCPNDTCSAACVFGERRGINKLVLEATELIQTAAVPMYFIHLIDPHYFRQPGNLASISVDGLFQSLRRRMRNGDSSEWSNALAVGGVHVSLDRYPNGVELWTPHAHLIVAVDVSRKEVRDTMRPRCRTAPVNPNGTRVRTIVIDEITELANAVSYATKINVDTREVSTDFRGNQGRLPFKLPESAQLEFDLWLLKQCPRDRVFLSGIMQTRGGLRLRTRHSA